MCSDGSAKSKEHARVSKDEDGVGLHASRRIAAQPSTTLADLLTLLFAANPFLTMRASLRR